jgi:hypothetical protein
MELYYPPFQEYEAHNEAVWTIQAFSVSKDLSKGVNQLFEIRVDHSLLSRNISLSECKKVFNEGVSSIIFKV